jgi:hypothetical protein
MLIQLEYVKKYAQVKSSQTTNFHPNWTNVIKLFKSVTYTFLYKTGVFVSGKLFEPGTTNILA